MLALVKVKLQVAVALLPVEAARAVVVVQLGVVTCGVVPIDQAIVPVGVGLVADGCTVAVNTRVAGRVTLVLEGVTTTSGVGTGVGLSA